MKRQRLDGAGTVRRVGRAGRLSRVRIRTRLLALVLIPLLALAGFAAQLANERLNQARIADRILADLDGVVAVGRLRWEVSGEGVIAYAALRMTPLAGSGVLDAVATDFELATYARETRATVDTDLAIVRRAADLRPAAAVPTLTLLDRLPEVRRQVDAGSIDEREARAYYDDVAASLHRWQDYEIDRLNVIAAGSVRMSQVNTALNAFDSWAEFASAAIEEVDALSEFIGVPSWVRPESREVLATAIARQDGARGEMERALPPRTASIWSAATITPRYVAYEDQRGRVLQIAGVSGTGPVPSVTSEKEIAARAELVVSSVERIGVIAELSPVLTADVADAASVVSASVRRSFDQAIAGAAIAGLVSLLFGVFVIRSIVRPLRHLEHQATQLRSGARHVGRMGAGGPAEIAVVGQALDEVVEYLAILEAQAEALAAGDVEADVLAHDGPGDLALSLKQSVRNLSAITERLRHQARHDQLTGLLNRAAAIQALEALLDDARRAEADVTLFFLDLDRFKLVNDTNGHEAGDYVLTEIAHRLRWLASDAVIARHGGDEFVVITTDGTPARSAELAEAMIQAIERPFMFAGVEHQLSASVGISRAPAGDATALKMLREADHAVYQAKERPGSGQVATFDEHTRRSADRRTRTEDDLRRAIEDDELDLHYQPIVSVTTGEILGVEALLRWPHPTRGLLVPDQFIPIADDSRLAIELGRWVLRAALGQAKAWKDEFGELPGRVGVNLSRRHLLAGVVTDVRAACAEQDAESAWLSLEIPESHLTADIESARRVFEELRDIGVGISIDEFGTGASALTQLRRLPVDTVKMDRALVRLLAAPDGDRAIVDAILTLASVFDLRVVAVGVETELQRDRLAALGCHGMQGWLVSTVLSADAMTAWLRDVEVVSLP